MRRNIPSFAVPNAMRIQSSYSYFNITSYALYCSSTCMACWCKYDRVDRVGLWGLEASQEYRPKPIIACILASTIQGNLFVKLDIPGNCLHQRKRSDSYVHSPPRFCMGKGCVPTIVVVRSGVDGPTMSHHNHSIQEDSLNCHQRSGKHMMSILGKDAEEIITW